MSLRDGVVFVQFVNKYTRPYQCGEMIYMYISYDFEGYV